MYGGFIFPAKTHSLPPFQSSKGRFSFSAAIPLSQSIRVWRECLSSRASSLKLSPAGISLRQGAPQGIDSSQQQTYYVHKLTQWHTRTHTINNHLANLLFRLYVSCHIALTTSLTKEPKGCVFNGRRNKSWVRKLLKKSNTWWLNQHLCNGPVIGPACHTLALEWIADILWTGCSNPTFRAELFPYHCFKGQATTVIF